MRAFVGLVYSLLLMCAVVNTVAAQAPFDMPGYEYSSLSGDGHYFQCKISSCGIGSGISFTTLTGLLKSSLSEYESGVRSRQSRNFQDANLSFGRSVARKVRGFTTYRVPMTVTKDGETKFWIIGLLTKNDVGITLNASSSSSAQAHRNFELFVRRLVKP